MVMNMLFKRKKKQTKKMAGIATGAAAAGALSAIMLTPKTGKEMRGHVAKAAKSVKHKAATMKQAAKQQAPDDAYTAAERATEPTPNTSSDGAPLDSPKPATEEPSGATTTPSTTENQG